MSRHQNEGETRIEMEVETYATNLVNKTKCMNTIA